MELLNKNSVIFDIEATSKEEVIRILVEHLNEEGCITSAQQFYDDVIERENICPTAIGFNMGLPHGRSHNVLKSAICFGRLNNEVVWNEETNEMAKCAILIAVPEENGGGVHMKVISSLARKLMHKGFRDILLQGSREEVFNFLEETIEN